MLNNHAAALANYNSNAFATSNAGSDAKANAFNGGNAAALSISNSAAQALASNSGSSNDCYTNLNNGGVNLNTNSTNSVNKTKKNKEYPDADKFYYAQYNETHEILVRSRFLQISNKVLVDSLAL